jgi:hypothetical protein
MNTFLGWRSGGVAALVALVTVSGCVVPGMGRKDRSLGFNGSFEIVRSGLPVNWELSRYPVKRGDAEFALDTTDPVDGDQSLRIVVRRIAADQWGEPFLFQVREAEPGVGHAVSFWLKNRGSRAALIIKNEERYAPFFGLSDEEKRDYAAHPAVRAVLDESKTGADEWRRYQYVYTVPETDGTIRFELRILRPGILWIDDVRIEPVLERGSGAEAR